MSDLILLRESGIAIDFSKVQLSEAILESTNDKGMYLTLPVCILDKPTANKRTYTSEMMSKSIQEAATAIAGRRLLCSADDHPQGTHVAPIHASHIVIEAWVDNGVLWNKWFILDTDNGRNLQALIRGRASVGTSIRGLGSMSRLNHVENYQYLGTDAVGNPAAGTYALPGVEGVKVEVCESAESFLEAADPEYVKGIEDTVKNYGFKYSHQDDVTNVHYFRHPDGSKVLAGTKGWKWLDKNGGNALKGQEYDTLERHLRTMHKGTQKESADESVSLPGVGEVTVGTVLQYKGLEWKVESIVTSGDLWKLTLVNTTNSMMNTWLRSEDIPNPASQMVIIAESKGNVMSKVQNYLDKINEAASKLAGITQKSNSKHDQLKFISMFESDLSNAKDLSGEELKGVLEQWESLKVEACKPKPASTIDDQMSQLKGTVSELTSLVHQVLNNKLSQVNEEEQKQIAVMRQFYSFDDRKVKEALSAYSAHKDDPKSFAEELISRLGVQVGGVNLNQLFDDLTDAAGDYQHTGVPAVAQNLVTSERVEELQAENAEYEALLDEFVTKVDSGELLSKEFVVEQMTKVITESRNTIRRHQVREALAVEVAVETIIKSTLNSKKLAESNKQNAQLVEALTVIINNLRESLLKKEGKIIATDYTKDKKTFIPGRTTR